MIRSFTQMMLSRDDKVREAMRWFTEDERRCRRIGEDPDSDFLNWRDERGGDGTASLAARTRITCKELKIKLKLLEDEEMLVKTEESELKTKTADGIGHFLTQKVIRPNLYEKLIAHEVHGASYTTLKANEVSNKMLVDIYSRRSDAFFRFTIVGRADCLPTPVNLRRWFEDRREEVCPRCGKERQQTMAHILNECTRNYPLMTRRHNKLANVVRRGIEQFLAEDLRSTIQENEEIRQEGLPDELGRLRPDMVFERQKYRGAGEVRFYRDGEEAELRIEERVTEIIEFSCPYGYISRGRSTLERVYQEKKRKYTELARTLKRLRKGEVRVTAVIVSSMGAVYDKSLKDLQQVLRCTDRELKKLGRKMSEAVIIGSMEIWRQNAKDFRGGTSETAEAVIEEEVQQLDHEMMEEERDTIEEMNSRREDVEEEHQEDEADDFDPEGGREDVEIEWNPGYVIRAEAEARVEAEAVINVGSIVEAEAEAGTGDRREENPVEQVEAKPRWGERPRGRGRGRGRMRGRRGRRQDQLVIEESQGIPEREEEIQFDPQDIGMERIGSMENPADDEESTADDIWM
jgi:hypothetical protein